MHVIIVTLIGRNFLTIVEKAKSACENAGMKVEDHFAEFSKMVSLGSGSKKNISIITLLSVICSLAGAFIQNNCHRQKMSRRLSATWQRETKTRKQTITSDKLRRDDGTCRIRHVCKNRKCYILKEVFLERNYNLTKIRGIGL